MRAPAASLSRATRATQAAALQGPPERKMTDLDSSVGDLVQRLQSLSQHSSASARRADQAELDGLRGRLRGSGGAAARFRPWQQGAMSEGSDLAAVR